MAAWESLNLRTSMGTMSIRSSYVAGLSPAGLILMRSTRMLSPVAGSTAIHGAVGRALNGTGTLPNSISDGGGGAEPAWYLSAIPLGVACSPASVGPGADLTAQYAMSASIAA